MRSLLKIFLLLTLASFLSLLYFFHNRFSMPKISIFQTEQDDKTIIPARIWYDPKHPDDNRILAQMTYVPEHYRLALQNGNPPKKKLIMRYSGYPHEFYGAPVVPGEKTFEKCPVNRCVMVDDMKRISEMDAIVFEGQHPIRTRDKYPSKQIWAVYKCECPFSSSGLLPGDKLNWTATYRRESTLAMPSFTFVPSTSSALLTKKSYAEGKTKKVAWFVSNCHMVRNERMTYAKELGQYITVDVYGRCGDKKCGRQGSEECFEMLRRDYKFYLAFENANCRQYISEKFFKNGLMSDTLPVVMGGHPDDYLAVAPPHSFIHVDDFDSPRELAEYLHILDKDDTLYNSYFKWKSTGHYISSYDTNFWCRFCSLLHDQDKRPPTWYEDTNKWWRGKGICVRPKSWKENGMYSPSNRPLNRTYG